VVEPKPKFFFVAKLAQLSLTTWYIN